MGAKRLIRPFTLLSTQSLGASFSSAATNIENLDRVALYITCTTTDAVGTVSVQGSVDGNNWVALPISLTALASANQDYLIDIQQTAMPQIRINYARTSGTGTMTATISAKES